MFSADGVEVSQAAIIREVINCEGMLGKVSENLNIHPRALHRYLNLDDSFLDAIIYSKDQILDEAEAALRENLKSEDTRVRQRAAEFVLSRLGAFRGWSEKKDMKTLQKDALEVGVTYIEPSAQANQLKEADADED